MSSSSTIAFAHRLIVTVMVVALTSTPLDAEDRHRVVRVLHSVLAQTLDDVYAASPSARALIDRLERSDLLIHVTAMALDRHHKFVGTTRFVVAAGGRRFLRITVEARLPADRRAATLAHELQHAAEVADAAFVVDHGSFAALYRKIGHESGGDPHGSCFETPAAIRVGACVLEEFRAAGEGKQGGAGWKARASCPVRRARKSEGHGLLDQPMASPWRDVRNRLSRRAESVAASSRAR